MSKFVEKVVQKTDSGHQTEHAAAADFEFEKAFGELQADMISVCMTYIDDCGVETSTVNNIYIHCVDEHPIKSCNFFFRINKKMVQRENVSEAARDREKGYQRKALRSLLDVLYSFNTLCKQHDRPMPTEMRLNCDVQENSLETALKYEPVVNIDDKVNRPGDTADAWFDELDTGVNTETSK